MNWKNRFDRDFKPGDKIKVVKIEDTTTRINVGDVFTLHDKLHISKNPMWEIDEIKTFHYMKRNL